jgi:hypothetical protein
MRNFAGECGYGARKYKAYKEKLDDGKPKAN